LEKLFNKKSLSFEALLRNAFSFVDLPFQLITLEQKFRKNKEPYQQEYKISHNSKLTSEITFIFFC